MLNALSIFLPLLLAVLIASRFRTKLNSRDSGILMVSFLMAMLTVIPAIMIRKTAEELGYKLETSYSTANNVLFVNMGIAFFTAFIDELNKYIVIVAYAYRRKEFDEPLAGILVAVMIALGFTLSQNIFYILREDDNYLGTWRMLSSIPFSMCFAVVLGFNAGMSKYGLDSDDLSSFGLRMKGLFLAILYHAFYDFFQFVEDFQPVSFLVTIVIIVLLGQVGLSLFRARRLHVRLMYSRSRRNKQASDNPFS
jgi:RsiW-degrading membrane proteinase PrsW (M82 family)